MDESAESEGAFHQPSARITRSKTNAVNLASAAELSDGPSERNFIHAISLKRGSIGPRLLLITDIQIVAGAILEIADPKLKNIARGQNGRRQ